MQLKAVIHQLRETPSELLLVVHPDIQALSRAREEIASSLELSIVPVGAELSAHLLKVQRNERGRMTSRWFFNRVNELSPGPVLCIDIDLLFEPSLELDPLTLFRQAGARTPLVVLWPGEFSGGALSYAVPEHRNYRTWYSPNASIFSLD